MAQPSDPGSVSTRREFLKATAAAGAVAAGTLSFAPPVHAAGSDTIRLGLIGCGDRGTGAALQALSTDRGAKLVAMADIFEDRLRASRKQLAEAKPDQVAVPEERSFVGFDGCRRVIESGVDAVLIACASRFHPTYLKACVEAGKHVFVEKPHGIDPCGIRTVAAACEEAKKKNLTVVSGLHRRYDPAIRETMKRVLDGAIGEILSIEVSFMRAPYKVVQRRAEWSEIEWQFRNWYHFSWLSGDDVPQSLVHTIDVGAWALRDTPPVSVHGLAGRSASFGVEYGDVFDHHAVVFEFASGARMYGLVRTQNGCHGDVAVKLAGTRGRAEEGRIEGQTRWSYEGPNPGGHQAEQTEFLASIRAGRPINNGDYMARSTLMGIAGQMACYTGRKITWEEALGSRFCYEPREGRCDFGIESPVKPGPDGLYPVPVPGKTQLT